MVKVLTNKELQARRAEARRQEKRRARLLAEGPITRLPDEELVFELEGLWWADPLIDASEEDWANGTEVHLAGASLFRSRGNAVRGLHRLVADHRVPRRRVSDGEPREHFRYLITARRYGKDKWDAWYGIYDERGRMIEECYTANDERPWRGREPSACRYRLGDAVAVLPLRPGAGRACIGVVNALPASPAWIQKLGLSLEAHEDVYLVGFPAPEGATEPSLDHVHPTQGVLVRVTSPVSPSLLRRLGHRFFEFRRGDVHDDEGNAFVERHRARLERRFGLERGESSRVS